MQLIKQQKQSQADKRMEDIENLNSDTKNKLFFLIDNVFQNVKSKKAFA